MERSGATDLVVERGEVAFESLVLALQSLHSGEVVADVVDVERVVLLLDPVLRLVRVAVVALHLVRRAERLRALLRRLLQRGPALVEVCDLNVDLLCSLGLAHRRQLLCDRVQLHQPRLVRLHVFQVVVELALVSLHLVQVVADL